MSAYLPLWIVLSSLLPGLAIFLIGEQRQALRTALNLGGAMAKLGLVGLLIWGVLQNQTFENRLQIAPGLELVLGKKLPHFIIQRHIPVMADALRANNVH